MIKAILFDIDGVLIDSFEANLKFFQQLMTLSGFPIPTREEYSQMFHLSLIDVIKKITKLTKEQDIQKIFELAKDRSNYPYDLITSPPNTTAVVKKLSKKFSIGLVTSRITSAVFSIPQLAELRPFVSVLVAFEDTTNHKPDPEPLLLATQKLSIRPNEAIYIGDAETDFKAAKAAGMKIIMYRNHTMQNPDGFINTFSDLENVINSLR